MADKSVFALSPAPVVSVYYGEPTVTLSDPPAWTGQVGLNASISFTAVARNFQITTDADGVCSIAADASGDEYTLYVIVQNSGQTNVIDVEGMSSLTIAPVVDGTKGANMDTSVSPATPNPEVLNPTASCGLYVYFPGA